MAGTFYSEYFEQSVPMARSVTNNPDLDRILRDHIGWTAGRKEGKYYTRWNKGITVRPLTPPIRRTGIDVASEVVSAATASGFAIRPHYDLDGVLPPPPSNKTVGKHQINITIPSNETFTGAYLEVLHRSQQDCFAYLLSMPQSGASGNGQLEVTWILPPGGSIRYRVWATAQPSSHTPQTTVVQWEAVANPDVLAMAALDNGDSVEIVFYGPLAVAMYLFIEALAPAIEAAEAADDPDIISNAFPLIGWAILAALTAFIVGAIVLLLYQAIRSNYDIEWEFDGGSPLPPRLPKFTLKLKAR